MPCGGCWRGLRGDWRRLRLRLRLRSRTTRTVDPSDRCPAADLPSPRLARKLRTRCLVERLRPVRLWLGLRLLLRLRLRLRIPLLLRPRLSWLRLVLRVAQLPLPAAHASRQPEPLLCAQLPLLP